MDVPHTVISQWSGAMAGSGTCKSQDRRLPMVVRSPSNGKERLLPSALVMISRILIAVPQVLLECQPWTP
jgi:hypothetical protein